MSYLQERTYPKLLEKHSLKLRDLCAGQIKFTKHETAPAAWREPKHKGPKKMGTILLILLVLLLIGALPTWPYSSGWGYYPTGGLGLILIILLVLVVLGRV
jgi:hypothetical protein